MSASSRIQGITASIPETAPAASPCPCRPTPVKQMSAASSDLPVRRSMSATRSPVDPPVQSFPSNWSYSYSDVAVTGCPGLYTCSKFANQCNSFCQGVFGTLGHSQWCDYDSYNVTSEY